MKLNSIETRGNEVRITLDHQYIMTMEQIDLQIRTTTQWLQILLKAKKELEDNQ